MTLQVVPSRRRCENAEQQDQGDERNLARRGTRSPQDERNEDQQDRGADPLSIAHCIREYGLADTLVANVCSSPKAALSLLLSVGPPIGVTNCLLARSLRDSVSDASANNQVRDRCFRRGVVPGRVRRGRW
jgi:hypothetical protein